MHVPLTHWPTFEPARNGTGPALNPWGSKTGPVQHEAAGSVHAAEV
jgi:hypothetical protein